MQFFLLIIIKFIYSNYLQSFNANIVDENASMIDITDYDNIYPLILTNRKLYLGIPPIFQFEINSTILNISAAATFNENIILLACTKDALLSEININSSESIDLISYEDFNLSISNVNYTLNYSCSICISQTKKQVFIGISQIIQNSLQNKLIRVDLNFMNDDFLIDKTKIYSLDEVVLLNIKDLIYPRQISCETIFPLEEELGEPLLVCGYIKQNYQSMAILMNSNFSNIENETIIKESAQLISFKLQRINNTFVKYLITNNSYEIFLAKENSKYIIKKTDKYYKSFSSFGDLFYYNNNYLFISYPTNYNNIKDFYLFIKANFTSNYMRSEQNRQYVNKIIGFYNIIDDKFIFYFEYSNTIKYYTITNITFLYNYKCKSITDEYYSNSIIKEYNISELITYPHEFEKLDLYYTNIFKTTTSHPSVYSSLYKFDINSQILTINSSINDWKLFYFSYKSASVYGLTQYLVLLVIYSIIIIIIFLFLILLIIII